MNYQIATSLWRNNKSDAIDLKPYTNPGFKMPPNELLMGMPFKTAQRIFQVFTIQKKKIWMSTLIIDIKVPQKRVKS